jgi:NAD(P)-dependent dehydrogenase (short-subunit alcohol dehydrogenase family)
MTGSLALAGKRALVTGAGRGIGAAIALAFAENGARVACAARTQHEIEDVAERCGGGAIAVALDVGSEESVAHAVSEAAERLGGIDIVINNAGIGGSWRFTKLDLAEWRRVMAVDLDGPFLVTRAVLPRMLEQGAGRVVTIASILGRVGKPYVSPYVAAKHGVIGLTRALAAEYGQSGITFNCVCPGFTESPMTEETVRSLSVRLNGGRDEALALLHTPQGRLVHASEVASLCLLLASTEGAAINGQAIVVDGGEVQA